MNLRLLRYFEAVAREGSVTRAAETLGIQQAPLSQQIMALEAELGVELFVRKPRGMELTEAGRVLLGRGRAILADVEAAARETRRAGMGQIGSLSIGLTTSASLHPLPARLIRAFREERPDVSLDLIQDSSEGLLRRVADGALDAAFVRTVSKPPKALRILPLDREEMRAALPRPHRLASRTKPVRLADLAGETFIGYPHGPGAGMYEAVVRTFRNAGIEFRTEFSVPQIFGTLGLVAAGLGVTILPQSLEAVRLRGVTFSPLDAPALTADLNLAIAADPATGPTAAFEQMVKGADA